VEQTSVTYQTRPKLGDIVGRSARRGESARRGALKLSLENGQELSLAIDPRVATARLHLPRGRQAGGTHCRVREMTGLMASSAARCARVRGHRVGLGRWPRERLAGRVAAAGVQRQSALGPRNAAQTDGRVVGLCTSSTIGVDMHLQPAQPAGVAIRRTLSAAGTNPAAPRREELPRALA